jgi:hypothetical protein
MSSQDKYEPGAPGFDDKHLERGTSKEAAEGYVVTADDRHRFDHSDLDQVQRRLKQRHVQMSVSFHLPLLGVHSSPQFIVRGLRNAGSP